jgi:flagellar export protein FliJ
MARFRFALDPVLRQRKREEQDKQRVVARLERERIEIEDEIRGYQASIVDEKAELTARLDAARLDGGGGGVDLGAVRVQANASLHLITLAQRAALRLAGVYERLDVARLALLEATTRRKAVEVLRDKRYDAWRRGLNRAEAAALDEIAVMGHSRRVEGDRS